MEENFNRCTGFVHEIEEGDTLYKLGKQYEVKVAMIMLANPYMDVYHLQPKDELCIPRPYANEKNTAVD